MGLAPIIESAAPSGRGECVGADGLIDPSQFACRASDLQPSRVEMAAEELDALGDAVRWEMTGIATDWASLRPWYVAPEQEAMLALMDSPADDARDMQECLRTASNALTTYAGELVPIQRDLANLEWRAGKFRERALLGVLVPVSESARPTLLQATVGLLNGAEPQVRVYWRESAEAVAENDALLAEYGQIIERLSTAADDVENTILGLLTDSTSLADTHPIPAESFDSPYVEMPWGWPAKEDMNVLEDIADGGSRVWDGLLAFLPMLGIDTATGRQGPAVAVESWLGVGNVLGSVALAAAYPESKHPWFAQLSWMQERYRTAETAGMLAGYDAAALAHGESPWHEWRDNPWATGMDTAFNVLSFLAPTAGAARFAGLSARTARWARITGVGADFLVPGGSYAVAGAARVTSDLVDLARFGDRIPGVSLRPAGVSHLADEIIPTADRPGDAGAAGQGTGSDGTRPGSGPEASAGGDNPPGRPPEDPPETGGEPRGDDSDGHGQGSSGPPTPPDPLTPFPQTGDYVGVDPLDRPELLSPWRPGVVSSVRPLQPDLEWASTYPSGDLRRPGWYPPQSPANTFTPGSGGEGWYAEVREVNKPSFQYQIQVSGIEPNANGLLPEYYRTGPNGIEVSYDGMVVRDGIPFHQEMKNGWDDLAFDPNSSVASDTLDDWIDQAQRQLAALPPDGVLEWHLSNPHAAAAVAETFAIHANGLTDVVVLYTPGV